ncbi:uncharacterized protein AMSG_03883 [Thecamonas trahens ATCC 50062]|uniref:Uncharacterized protein n=1 Tax=Thecamonas trahens ATCC 50062 TaxID=461836 RepID=A0A0L0D8N7_THETB|nr:hypothetical protein AMSG_03883 [Thecamonas trahens ATCC 50062]KNC47653.1 hypothetical protein AMSG_03883 [Thecamonas trahens ATCC 50062]|eukprot:XP_013759137.1 hypothetical protein AMSG_03883 [Thecamonas trahens ATCC 50062]
MAHESIYPFAILTGGVAMMGLLQYGVGRLLKPDEHRRIKQDPWDFLMRERDRRIRSNEFAAWAGETPPAAPTPGEDAAHAAE